MRSYKSIVIAAAYLSWSAFSLPVPSRREVPQEHSHEPFLTSVRASLNLNNPDGIADPVFGLLGNAAAAAGAGKITNLDCLQQATADQAFTNAKAAGDIDGMVGALIFRALERNTGKVGLQSVVCTEIAVNPEIAAITQHQDPASEGAAATNKAITLELAKQIASVGGNPQDALKSGTFAPGDLNDSTGKGNSCDDADDPNGCIFTQNLLVSDATPEEIDAAVSGISAGGNATDTASVTATETAIATTTDSAVATATSVDSTATCGAITTVTVTATPAAETTATATAAAGATPTATSASAAVTTATSPAANDQNLQQFTGALGGVSAPVVTPGGRGFEVANNDDFLNLAAALGRSCDVQHNQCANKANSGGGFNVGACDQQNNDCHALIK